MRYLAWVAMLSLQMGMFVCGAGFDVCPTSGTSSYMETQQDSSNSNTTASDSVCVAHALHVFLWQESPEQYMPYVHAKRSETSLVSHISEVFSLIEQPPKRLYS